MGILARYVRTNILTDENVASYGGLAATCRRTADELKSHIDTLRACRTVATEQMFRDCIGIAGTTTHRATGLRALPGRLHAGAIKMLLGRITLCNRRHPHMTCDLRTSKTPECFVDMLQQRIRCALTLSNMLSDVVSTSRMALKDPLLNCIHQIFNQDHAHLELQHERLNLAAMHRLAKAVSRRIETGQSIPESEVDSLLVALEFDSSGLFRPLFINALISPEGVEPPDEHSHYLALRSLSDEKADALRTRYFITHDEITLGYSGSDYPPLDTSLSDDVQIVELLSTTYNDGIVRDHLARMLTAHGQSD